MPAFQIQFVVSPANGAVEDITVPWMELCFCCRRARTVKPFRWPRPFSLVKLYPFLRGLIQPNRPIVDYWSGEMQTRKLRISDLNITAVGFGAWAIGGGGWEFGWGEQEDVESIAAIKRALELGINWIDTAAVYGLGHSEEIVGKALTDWK